MLTVLRQLHIPAVLHFIAYPHRETGQRLDREQELLKASCSLAYQLAETLPDYASFSADFDFGAHMEAMQASSEADPIAATNAAIDLIEKFLSMGPPLLFCLVDGIQLLESYKNPPREGRSEAYNRFVREAETTGKLQHQSIVDVFDVAQTTDGRPFIVMELLVGEGLDDRLKRARLHIDELAVLTGSAERIADRIERGVSNVPRSVPMADIPLPSNSIMNRLDSMRSAQ